MSNKYRPFINCSILGLLLLVTVSCMQGNDPPELALVELKVQFVEAGTETPITEQRIDISIQISGEEEPFYQGAAITDEIDGTIEGFLESANESTIVKLFFDITIDDVHHSIEEVVDLQYRFEEPYDSVDLVIEVGDAEEEEEPAA